MSGASRVRLRFAWNTFLYLQNREKSDFRRIGSSGSLREPSRSTSPSSFFFLSRSAAAAAGAPRWAESVTATKLASLGIANGLTLGNPEPPKGGPGIVGLSDGFFISLGVAKCPTTRKKSNVAKKLAWSDIGTGLARIGYRILLQACTQTRKLWGFGNVRSPKCASALGEKRTSRRLRSREKSDRRKVESAKLVESCGTLGKTAGEPSDGAEKKVGPHPVSNTTRRTARDEWQKEQKKKASPTAKKRRFARERATRAPRGVNPC